MVAAADDIAKMIDTLRHYYVAASFGLVLLNDDDVLAVSERKGYDLGTTTRLGRRDNPYHDSLPDLWAAIQTVRGSEGFQPGLPRYPFHDRHLMGG